MIARGPRALVALGLATALLGGLTPFAASLAAAADTSAASSPAGFTAVTPCRVYDTRTGTGTCSGSTHATARPVSGGAAAALRIKVVGVAGVPASATSVVLNLTAVDATASGYLTVYPDGTTAPATSNLNRSDAGAHAAAVTVRLGSNGVIDVLNSAGTVQVAVDIAGYYAPGGGGYTSLQPCRLLDTRVGSGTCAGGPTTAVAPVHGGVVQTVKVAGAAGVPANASAVVLNLAATGLAQTSSAYVTAYPTGKPRPTASNLNVLSSAAIANLVTVPLGTGGSINLVTSSGTVNLVVDLAGYYAAGSGSLFVAVNPCRVYDTRVGRGTCTAAPHGPLAAVRGPGGIAITLPGVAGIPAGATGALLNVTATQASRTNFVAAVPDDTTTAPSVSTVNVAGSAPIANLAQVRLPAGTPTAGGAAGVVDLYASAGSVHLVTDLEGYFAPSSGTQAATPTSSVSAMRTNALATPPPIAVGHQVMVAGAVVDGSSGSPAVVLQRLDGSAWVTQSTATVTGVSYAGAVTPAASGTTVWRSRASWPTGQVLFSGTVQLVAGAPFSRATTNALPSTLGALRPTTVSGSAVNNLGLSGTVAVQYLSPALGWTTFHTFALPAFGGAWSLAWTPDRVMAYSWRSIATWADGTTAQSAAASTTVVMVMDFAASGPLTQANVPYSYRAGCPVGPSSLRALSMNYLDFNGVVQRGTLVLDAGSVGAIEAVLNVAEIRSGFRIKTMIPTDHFYVGGFATSPTGSDINSMNAGNTSEFNCRSVTGNPYRISQHSYGNAIDINTFQNPYVVGSTIYPAAAAAYVYDRAAHYGDIGVIAPGGAVATAMANVGWLWGARWSSPDFQHFSSNGG